MRRSSVLAAFALTMVAGALKSEAASAQALVLQTTYSLSPQLEQPNNNFAPQGLGYDAFANELLFIQQNTWTIYRTDLTGNVLGSVALGTTNYNYPGGSFADVPRYTVSVTADATNYYFSDYTCNNYCSDLFAVSKSGGNPNTISTEVAAYGGYPIDFENGLLYRTEASTSYDYSNLNDIRVAPIGSPDAIIRTLTLSGPGIADFSIDSASNSIFTLDYSATAQIRRYDLLSGALLQIYAPIVDGTSAGLTFANGNLYLYDWQAGQSTLSVFQVTGLQGAVPEPATWAMMLLGFGATGLAMRRSRKTLMLAT